MENKLKDIFQNKLENFQAPVDATAWSAIQSGISGGAAATGGGFLASIGAKIAAAVLAGALIIGSVFLINQEENSLPVVENNTKIIIPTETENTKQKEIIISEEIAELVLEENSIIKQKKEKTTTKSKIEKPIKNLRNDLSPQTSILDGVYVPNEISTPKSENPEISNEGSTNPQTAQHNIETNNSETPKVDQVIAINSNFQYTQSNQEELVYELNSSNENEVTYLWEAAGKTYYETNPIIDFSEQGVYDVVLTVTDLDGNSKTTTKTIEAILPASWKEEINVFTPNGDGVNDYFDPSDIAINIDVQSLVISKNNGDLVFDSYVTNILKWDGTLSDGTNAAEGKYVFFIIGKEHNGSIVHYRNTFNLKR